MSLSRILSGMDISASGLAAERKRMDVVAQNIANAHTTRGVNGQGPYRRQSVSFASALQTAGRSAPQSLQGVRVTGIVEDQSPFPQIYDPGHPDADANGLVRMPNVNLSHEMVDMMTAKHAYEANLKALESFRQIAEQALSLLRGIGG